MTPSGMDVAVLTKGLGGLLGLAYPELSGDAVTVTARVTPELLQPWGVLHGGVHCAMVETAASIGAQLWLGDRGVVVGVSNHTDFLRGVADGELIARATPVHRGRSQQLWQVDVRDGEDRLLATGKVRLQNLAPPAQTASPEEA